ncbi:MAG: vitamin B12 dependent-methionine synthase activation domain-containing protein, partial [Bacilli bacterium]
GGAALTRKFSLTRIAPEYDGMVLYAKDAMDGLSIANNLAVPDTRSEVAAQFAASKAKSLAAPVRETREKVVVIDAKSDVDRKHSVRRPKDLKRHVIRSYDAQFLNPYINRQMLLGHHLGLKGNVKQLIADGDTRAVQLASVIDDLLSAEQAKDIFTPQAVYQFFPAQADGNKLLVYSPENEREVIGTFDFPRQGKAPFLCLSDYVKPVESGEMDYIGLFVVTCGKGPTAFGRQWKDDGEFLKSHAVQALGLELAEAFAERIHQQMRDDMGITDSVDMTMEDRFRAHYIGQRFSFGYPACPNLEDQATLFQLLDPSTIGVALTEGFMMEPEASVSAIVFSHPEARYFNV